MRTLATLVCAAVATMSGCSTSHSKTPARTPVSAMAPTTQRTESPAEPRFASTGAYNDVAFWAVTA
jgi:hypothetical protein